MADNNERVVYPDEVEAVKEAAAKSNAAAGGDNNSIEVPEEPADAAATVTPQVTMRNMIQVPDNCPPGYKLVDGVCREVFN